MDTCRVLVEAGAKLDYVDNVRYVDMMLVWYSECGIYVYRDHL